MRRRVLLTFAALAVTGVAPAVPAHAAASELAGSPIKASIVSVQAGDPLRQRALSNGSVWKSFRAHYGAWNALWNEATGTPHRAFGPSIPLRGFANDAASADRAVRAFIASQPALFGGGGIELQTAYAGRHGNVWYVRYRQLVHGVPVMFSDWEFRIGTNGRLMVFGADPRATTGADVSAGLVGAAAREAAKVGIAFDPLTDKVTGGTSLSLAPVRQADGRVGLVLVTPVTLQTRKPHYESEQALVDAHTGAVVWRQRERFDANTGVVTAPVHLTLPTDPLVTRPVRHVAVNAVNGMTTVTSYTDTTGLYSVTPSACPTTITSSFSGLYCMTVRNDGGADALFSQSGNCNTAKNITWTTNNSKDPERDAYYHVNIAHDWVTSIDTSYHANDNPLTTNVMIAEPDGCDAYWDQPTNSLNFDAAGATCPATTSMANVVWHEYCHSISYKLYYANGAPNGLTNATLAEGLADAFAALLGDYPVIGSGFSGPGTYLRDVRQDLVWPEDASSSAHTTGLILAGALWDLRTATSNALASHDMHFAKYGLPDDPDVGVAFGEYFLDMLAADDNDGDLSNGTPNMNAIITAFNSHGIGTNYFIGVTHTPLDDQPTNGPYPIVCQISYSAPIGFFDHATLYYSVNGTPYDSLAMQPNGNPDEYEADFPSQSYGIAKYYLRFFDSFGGVKTLPSNALNGDVYQFIAGPATTMVDDDMESDPGWTVGFSGDAATTGIWVRAIPQATPAQPGDQHTPGGQYCWVTGNSVDPQNPGLDDVDGGKTTLVTNSFNAVPGGLLHPIITYWRWYSDNLGDNPQTDPWRTYISNDNGSTWKIVENTTVGTGGWKRISFFISKYVTPTSTMKMRFVAQDTAAASLVEAAVDDWYLVAYPTVLAVPPASAGTEFSASMAPNPFQTSTHVRFSLPEAGRVSIDVYDLAGRKVRTLVNGARPPGAQSVDWDGRDAAGRLAPDGPYYIRLSRADRVISRAVVLRR